MAKNRAFSEKEQLLMDKINSEDLEEVKILLKDEDVKINSVNKDGLSFISQAAFKGNFEICKLLIESGANINESEHAHGYTALMFAAIGGHLKVVNLLLESGANIYAVNSVGRTALQMAAFVGQHEAVTLINNFVPQREVEYFTKINGLEKEPKLKPKLLQPLCQFLRQTNIHPIRIILSLEKYPDLLDNCKQVVNVLELMMNKEMKKADPNEMLALKYSHLSFLLSYFQKHLIHLEEKYEDKQDKLNIVKKCIDLVSKNLLAGRDSDDFPINLENFLRESIKQFPFHESAIFVQLIKTLSGVKIGDEPSALTLLSKTVSGQKGFPEDVHVCATCGEPKPSKKCSKCKTTQYCDQQCQKLHWFSHKKICERLKTKLTTQAIEVKVSES
jgi:ankyrin repeat and MYND domain-containing protein 2